MYIDFAPASYVEFVHAFNHSTEIIATMDEFRKDVMAGKNVFFILIWLFLLVL